MDLEIKAYLGRVDNELRVADILKRASEEKEPKTFFQLDGGLTFYSSVISHSYYAIFYMAKALLLTKGIKTEMPDVHKKTYEVFKEVFVDSGILDVELLNIYHKALVRADSLLQIFKDEKWKRGNFTYNTVPQANKEPAEESLNNALTFTKHIKQVIER